MIASTFWVRSDTRGIVAFAPVLTDYHVHLRPDGTEHRFEDAFTTANAERYQEVAAERGVEALGVSEHVYRFRQALEVWDHPYWREHAHDDIDAYCEFVRERTSLKLGIEADYVAGAEDRMANLLMCLEAGRPVALWSDAHTPNDLAYRYDEAVEYLESFDIREIAVFDGRARRMERVG
jgi:histidinol phosphatase-like PHP family hydrolase